MKITANYVGKFRRDIFKKRFRINRCMCYNTIHDTNPKEPMFRKRIRGFTIILFQYVISFDTKCRNCWKGAKKGGSDE